MCRLGGPKCPKISIKKRIGKLCWNIAGRQVLKRLQIFEHWLFNNQYFLTYQAKSDMANCRRLYPAIVIALSFNCWLTVRILPRRDTCNSPRDDMCPSLVLNTKIRKDYEDFIHTRSEIIHGGSEIIHAGSELNYCCCTTVPLRIYSYRIRNYSCRIWNFSCWIWNYSCRVRTLIIVV